MQHRKFAENFQENFLGHWGNIANVRKPIIAAVNGFALGGGKLWLIIPYDQVGYGFSNQRAQKLARVQPFFTLFEFWYIFLVFT